MRELEIHSTKALSDEDVQLIIAVATALHGVRMDLPIQTIVDVVTELYNEGHPWDNIGLSVISVVKCEGIH